MGESTATSDWLATPGRFQPLPSRLLLSDPRGLGVELQRMFTVSISARHPGRRSVDLESICREGIAALEHDTGHPFGRSAAPLLVAVRIASRPKVPGRSPAVLNVGLTPDGARELASRRGSPFAGELLVRLMATYARAVRKVPTAAIHSAQTAAGQDRDRLVDLLDALMSEHGGPLPRDPALQLLEAVRALQSSWNEPASQRDMRVLGIDPQTGIVAVQAMAYANASERSGKGVAVTRDLVTGEPGIRGQFVARSQGGIRLLGDPLPQPLVAMRRRHRTAYASLQSALALLEAAEQDMCAVEFVVESGALRVIDVRTGTSSGRASIRIAVDLVDAGLLGITDALARITPAALRIAQQPVPKRDHTLEAAVHGTPASPGTTTGEAALSAEQVLSCAARGGRPILLQERSARYDASTIAMCVGVVSADGGTAAQPVVLARMLGIPAISHSGAGPAGSSAAARKDTSELPARARIAAGEPLVLDADRGVLYRGATDLVAAQPDTYIARVLAWCVDHQRVPVLGSPPTEHVTISELTAGGTLPRSGTPVLIDVHGAGEDARSDRAVQVKAALRGGPRELVLRWSDDLEHEDGRIPVAPWTMIVAPDDRTWAAQLVATRLPLDTAALASIATEGAMT